MATQTLPFNAGTGLTVICKLFAEDSDVVVATETATELTNDLGRFTVAFTDIPAGTYRLNGFVGAVGGFVNEIYDLDLATAVYKPRSEQLAADIIGIATPLAPTVERIVGDTDAIRFTWPVSGATITGEVSKAGGSYSAVTGAITQRADEGTTHWYQLAYNAADRQLGSNRYKFTDGTYTYYVNLNIEPVPLDATETQTAAAAALTTYDPPTKAELDAAQASIESDIALISGLVLSPSPTVERVLGDEDAIRFSWPVDGATITGEVSKAGGAYVAVTGTISQRADEGTTHWYQLAYNAADRQLGSVRYKFTDGTYTRYVNLLVNPASAEVDESAIADAVRAELEPELTQIDEMTSTLTLLVNQSPMDAI